MLKSCVHQKTICSIAFLFRRHMNRIFWFSRMKIPILYWCRCITPPALIGLPPIQLSLSLVTPHSTEMRDNNINILFLLCSIITYFFIFHTLRLLNIFKLEIKFLFSCHVDRSLIIFS